MSKSDCYILGGNDAEMETIKGILTQLGIQFVQPRKDWGHHVFVPADAGFQVEPCPVFECKEGKYNDKESAEEKVCEACRGGGKIIRDLPKVIFVECKPDDDGWPVMVSYVIDHHDDASHKPASVQQVIKEIKQQLSPALMRWCELVAANDCDHINAMVAIGATTEEIVRVRALDRRAQGITPKQEIEAAEASMDTVGRLTTVRMTHSKCATVTDRLHYDLGGPGYDQLLIFSDEDEEVNFFGDGAICAELKKKFGGWAGGSGLSKKGASAYWGCKKPDKTSVARFIESELTASS